MGTVVVMALPRIMQARMNRDRAYGRLLEAAAENHEVSYARCAALYDRAQAQYELEVFLESKGKETG